MKLIFENWRSFITEETQSQNLGVSVDFERGYTITLVLVNLDAIKNRLFPQEPLSKEEFGEALKDPEMLNKAAVGWIQAMYNPMLSKAHPQMGGSGGSCNETYSVRRAIGRGFGRPLYNALLGFCAENDVYLTPDRHSVSPGAKSRWQKVDKQTDDEVPGSGKMFDKFGEKNTPELEDDCLVHGEPYLDKGYKDTSQIAFYKKLRKNLDSYFQDKIGPLLDEPGFLQRMFGFTKQSQLNKAKKQIMKMGKKKFHDWDYNPKKSQEEWESSKKT